MSCHRFRCSRCGGWQQFELRQGQKSAEMAAWHERNGHECEACRDAERSALAEQAAKLAQEAGLPALSGSAAQVTWAEQLRGKMLPLLDQCRIKARAVLDAGGAQAETARLALIGLELIEARDRASWWIEHRHYTPPTLLQMLRQEIETEAHRRTMQPASAEEADAEAAALEEATLRPAGEPISSHIVELRLEADGLRARVAVSIDACREVMHAHGLRWQAPEWRRQIEPARHGTPVERLADLARALVSAGMVVRVHDEAARALALSGEINPEVRRWVDAATSGQRAGWFALTWMRPDDLYADARRLPGSRYQDGTVYAPPGAADEVAEFAAVHACGVTPRARELMVQHAAALRSGHVVTARPSESSAVAVEAGSVPPRLARPTNVGIDADLLDD